MMMMVMMITLNNNGDDFPGVTSLFSAGLQLEENAHLLVLYKLAEALNILRWNIDIWTKVDN